MADLSILRQRLAVDISDQMLTLALTHRSYAYENGGLPTNERLEFLGDAILQVVVTTQIYADYPDMAEGQLARLRAAVVNANALAGVATLIDLGSFVLLGRGEEATDGRHKSSILADTTEAVIGAVYLDCGREAASKLVHSWMDPLIKNAAALGAGLDWKTSLQELTSKLHLGVPLYVVHESGPDHAKHFTAQVEIASKLYGHGEGRSKRVAEQEAAAEAFKELHAAFPELA